MKMPRISIVTPSLNRKDFIREAIESIIGQEYPLYEHIIVDGGSTDGSLSVIGEYPHLRLISEPDKGIYDALNKGIRMARGDIIGWLNTDDLYAEGAFDKVADTFRRHPEALAVAGGADMFTQQGDDRRVIAEYQAFGEGKRFWHRIVETPVTNAWFFSPEIFTRLGYFNTNYKLVADREFFIRAALAGIRAVPIHSILYHYRQHFGSATFSEDPRIPDRGMRVIFLLEEALTMLEAYLQRRDLPLGARLESRRLHSEQAAQMTLVALYHRQYSKVGTAISSGCRYDVFWPIYLMRRATRRIVKEMLGNA